MSRFEQTETVFTDAGFLCGALQDLGFQPEVHEEPVRLYGHWGDEREDVAHVIVRRDQIHSASNDMGFVRQPDGKFRAIVSEFDRTFSQNKIGMALNDTWLGRVAQRYKERQTMAVAKQRGYVLQSREEVEGKVRLKFAVRG
jgi:hypothetical protein